MPDLRLEDIPPEVIQAAELVGRFFEERGVEVWELGPVRNRHQPTPPCRRGQACACHNDCTDDPNLAQPRRFIDRPPVYLYHRP
jgi:hypothetical protein